MQSRVLSVSRAGNREHLGRDVTGRREHLDTGSAVHLRGIPAGELVEGGPRERLPLTHGAILGHAGSPGAASASPQPRRSHPAPPDPSRPHPTQGCAPGNRRAHQELTSATPSEAVFLSS